MFKIIIYKNIIFNINLTFYRYYNIPKLKKSNINIINYSFGVLNIKTFNDNNILIPYKITYKINLLSKIIYKSYNIKNYYINDIKLASFNMLIHCLKDINLLINKKIYLYVNNLGILNGYLLFNSIYNIDNNIKILLDKNNNFIEIKFKNIIIKDISRILPILKLNDINKLYEQLVYYIYFIYNQYNINFFNLYSISNLAMNIYRTNYYNNNIPILNNNQYELIKKAYYGGNIILNKNYGKNLYYYDVNSLYPYMMLKKMPGKYIKYHNNININDFINNDLFGFFYCTIIIPKNKPNIIINRDDKNNIYYPKNVVIGLYFSEEIKNYIKLGYIITISYGYEYTIIENLFNNYINDLYLLKSNSNHENIKNFNKLLLNSLYGYFGKNPINIITKLVDYKELNLINNLYEIISISTLSDNKFMIIYKNKLLNNLNNKELKLYIHNYHNHCIQFQSYTNIAISSAITSYGRIYMSKLIYKNYDNLYYSDTDSLILNKPLNNNDIGLELGKFKLISYIKELIIINNKTYAYIDNNNKIIIKSSGIPSHLLNYDDFKNTYFNNNTKILKFNKFNANLNNFEIKNLLFTTRLKNN